MLQHSLRRSQISIIFRDLEVSYPTIALICIWGVQSAEIFL